MRHPDGRADETAIEPVLPPELMNFLSRKSYSLLIKGEAATGKTILAISILKRSGEKDNFLYLSTRVSPSQLFDNHPWLSELQENVESSPGGEKKKKKTTTAEDKKEKQGQGQQNEEGEEEKDRQEEEQQPQARDRFVDARLDEPVPFFERITNELMDVRAPTIVVDSWDPIATMMDGEALLSNTKVLQTWRERAEAKIITLIEDSSNTTYDSLYDGVVTLDRYYEDARIVRMMQLLKLSGVKVNRPSYLFTLDGGIFRSFSTYNPMELRSGKSGGWSWEKRVRSTGYKELDAILDGTLPSGTIMSLSLGPGVNTKLLLLLLSGILGRGVRSSRTIMLFRPFQGIGLEQAIEVMGEVTLVPQYKPGRGESGEAGGVVESLRRQVQKLKSRRAKVVALVGSEFLLEVEDEEERERLLELLKSEIDTTVVVAIGGETLSEDASRVADLSLRLTDLNGTPMLQAQLPWTEYFALTAKVDHGPATLSLVPMV